MLGGFAFQAPLLSLFAAGDSADEGKQVDENVHDAIITPRLEEGSQELSGERFSGGLTCVRLDSVVADPNADSFWEVLAPA